MPTHLVQIALPQTATRPCLLLDDQDGRDQVVNAARADWSAFERPLPALLHACARRFSGFVIDIGANSGYYALLAAVSGAATRVMAFEPDVSVRALLTENVAANQLERQVAISDLALSDRSGSAELYVPTQEHGLVETSSSLEKTFKDAHSEIRHVNAITVDDFFSPVMWRLRLLLRGISLIKIDVEGHEAAVLRGGQTLIARHRPLIFIEVLPMADLPFLARFIAAHNYADVPLAPGELMRHDMVGFFQDAWNHAFVPVEKLGAFLSLANSLVAAR